MTKSLLKSLAPWLIFFILFSYDQYRMQIGAIGALLALLILSRQSLHKGMAFDWLGIFFFIFSHPVSFNKRYYFKSEANHHKN